MNMKNKEIKPNMLKYALKYANLGWSVIPLKQDKTPLFSWKEYQTKKADKKTIKQWWKNNPDANIGIVTGAISGIVVVDIEKGGNFEGYPETVTSFTGGGGRHLLFKHPGQTIPNSSRAIAELTDIRGDGGYIMAPPSIHPNSSKYQWEKQDFKLSDIASLPDPLFRSIKKSQYDKSTNMVLSGVPQGQRNVMAASIIGSILKKIPMGQWEERAWPKFKEWNDTNNPPLDTAELRTVFASIAKREKSSRVKPLNIEAPSSRKKIRFKITTSAEMLSKEVKPFPYIIQDLIPENGITAITADSGKGKSLFMFYLAKHIATGTRLFDKFEVKQKKVLIIDQEMNENLLVERYQGMVKKKIPLNYMYEQDWDILKLGHYKWLKKKIVRKDYGVVIFDTLTTIHGADENSAQEMKKVNARMLKLMRNTNVTLIYLHHHKKLYGNEKHSQSSARGSTEIIAKAACHLLIQSTRMVDIDERSVTDMTISQEKARRPSTMRPFGVKFIYDPESKATEVDYLGDRELGGEKLLEVKKAIMAELEKTDSITVTEIIEKTGAGASTVRQAINKLISDKKIDCYTDSKKHNLKYYFLPSKFK